MSNRAELVRRLIAYEAAVKAIKSGLKAEGEHEHRENGTAATYRMGYATVSGSQTNDRVEVVDLKSFMGYLAGRYPTEVKTVTVQVVINPEWLNQVKDALARISRYEYDQLPAEERQGTGPVVDADSVIIPGAEFVPGGEYITTSVTPNSTARRRALKAAQKGALEGDWSELERAITDPGYLTRDSLDEALEGNVERVRGRDVTVTNLGFAEDP
jgi:hypothetical protein